MNDTNKTNLKEQLVWILDKWLEHQDDYEKLNFFFRYEFHRQELTDYLGARISRKIIDLKKDYDKQEYTRQRYNRDGFYRSDSYKEQAEKIHKTNDERYKIHKVNY